jgi:hypothetical protein
MKIPVSMNDRILTGPENRLLSSTAGGGRGLSLEIDVALLLLVMEGIFNDGYLLLSAG